jgi:hypothetical protein
MIAANREYATTVYAVERRGEFILTIGEEKATCWHLVSEHAFRNEDRLMKAYQEQIKKVAEKAKKAK